MIMSGKYKQDKGRHFLQSQGLEMTPGDEPLCNILAKVSFQVAFSKRVSRVKKKEMLYCF